MKALVLQKVEMNERRCQGSIDLALLLVYGCATVGLTRLLNQRRVNLAGAVVDWH